MDFSKSLTPTNLYQETTESLMGTQEDLKLHLDSQEETDLFISKLHEQILSSERSQANYENLIQTLYKKLNSALSENQKLFQTNQSLQSTLKSANLEFSQKLESIQLKSQQKIEKFKENLDFQVKSLNQSTVSAISSKLHMEYTILKKTLKTAYNEKLRKKQRKWAEKYQCLDNFYQESLRSIQLLHSHRLSDTSKAAESLLKKYLNPSI